MIRLASIIERFEQPFLERYADRILPGHRQALAAMKCCRNQLSPRMLAQCTECDSQQVVPHSCGHRNCPHCQHHESQQWLERQLEKQVPATYFMLTFTLSRELRPLAWAHQRILYGLMNRCSWQTVQTFCRNDKQLKGSGGAITVLHTHSRRLDYHPHVHLVMPAAAIDTAGGIWRAKKARKGSGKDYLFNHRALAKVFRAKMLEAIVQEGLALPTNSPGKWVVDCTCVGTGEKALVYLGRYLYRGVIQEKDILACEDGRVSLRYQDGKRKRTEKRTVDGATFLWLLLQQHPAQRISAHPKLWLPACQQQTPHRPASIPLRCEPASDTGFGEKATVADLPVLRGDDGHRPNTATAAVANLPTGAGRVRTRRSIGYVSAHTRIRGAGISTGKLKAAPGSMARYMRTFHTDYRTPAQRN